MAKTKEVKKIDTKETETKEIEEAKEATSKANKLAEQESYLYIGPNVANEYINIQNMSVVYDLPNLEVLDEKIPGIKGLFVGVNDYAQFTDFQKIKYKKLYEKVQKIVEEG